MKTQAEINLEYKGINLVLDGYWYGRYYPATRETPEEYPEYTIEKITVEDSDINIYDLFNEDDLENIYTKIDYEFS